MDDPSFEHIFFPGAEFEKDKNVQISPAVCFQEGYNLLFHADNLIVLKFLKEQKLDINLIYIDPPYFTGTDELIDVDLNLATNVDGTTDQKHIHVYKKLAYQNKKPYIDSKEILRFSGFSETEISQGLWILSEHNSILKMIDKTLEEDQRNFCNWFYYRVKLMREVLSKSGIIAIRIDYHYGHYARLVLDTIFGENNFLGEIMIRRMEKNVSDKARGSQNQLTIANDSLFVYYKEIPPVKYNVKNKRDNLLKNEKNNREVYEMLKNWLEPKNNVWMDIIGYEKRKRTFYPTENSEALLERVIQTFSKKGDTIADFYLGSGVTVTSARKENRRWIGADIGHDSNVQTLRRILSAPTPDKFIWIRPSLHNTTIPTPKSLGSNNLVFKPGEFITESAVVTKSRELNAIYSFGAIIDYSFLKQGNTKIFSPGESLSNQSENGFVEIPDLSLSFEKDELSIISYSSARFAFVKDFEYILEYVMIVKPLNDRDWLCKSSQFGTIMVKKKKKEAPMLSFEISNDFITSLTDSSGTTKNGIILEICEITGLQFKIFVDMEGK